MCSSERCAVPTHGFANVTSRNRKLVYIKKLEGSHSVVISATIYIYVK